VAWHFLTLASKPGNDDILLVDCYDLPFVVDLDNSLENNFDMDYLVSSEESISAKFNVDRMNLSRETNVVFIHEHQENDNKNLESVLENVHVLTLAPQDKVPITDLMEFDDCCKMLEDEEEEENFTTKHTYFACLHRRGEMINPYQIQMWYDGSSQNKLQKVQVESKLNPKILPLGLKLQQKKLQKMHQVRICRLN